MRPRISRLLHVLAERIEYPRRHISIPPPQPEAHYENHTMTCDLCGGRLAIPLSSMWGSATRERWIKNAIDGHQASPQCQPMHFANADD